MNDGRFVSADTLVNRPMFRSVSGRPIVGGGGVTPDVVVRQDTASSAERELARAVGPQIPLMQDLILEVAREVAGSVRSGDFTVAAAWRDTLRARLVANEVVMPDSIWTAAEPVVDRLLAGQVAGLAIGDSVAFLRQAPADAQLRTARALILRAGDRTALLGLGVTREARP